MPHRRCKTAPKPTKTPPVSAPQGLPAADFKLETWQGPTREFRFVGWRDDYSAFFLLDGNDAQYVLTPVLLGFKGPVRFAAPPISITESRLLPPPCRRSRAEAELLRDMRKMVHGRPQSFHQVVKAYQDEAAKHEIWNPTLPEQWELIYQDVLYPRPSRSPRQWLTVQDELRAAWAKPKGLTKQGMFSEQAEFSRRHSGDLAIHAQARYRMECHGFVPVWLSDFNLDTLKAVGDIEQIQKLLAARPELVLVTPNEAEKELGIKPDPKHRTLKRHCTAAGVDVNKLNRVSLPLVLTAQKMRKENQRRGVTRANQNPDRAQIAPAPAHRN